MKNCARLYEGRRLVVSSWSLSLSSPVFITGRRTGKAQMGTETSGKMLRQKKTVPGQNLRKCRKFFVCKCWVWCNSAVWSQGRWTRTTGRKATGPTEWQNLRRGNTFHSPVPCAVCRYEPNKIDISSFGLAGVLYGERTPGQHLCI